MVDYVVGALTCCPDVGRIVLVGGASLREAYRPPPDLLFALPGDSPLGSLASGAAVLESVPDAADWIMACTGDIPFLTAGAVGDFLASAAGGGGFLLPDHRPAGGREAFSRVKRTYVRLRDGAFTGGNLFLVRRSIAGGPAEGRGFHPPAQAAVRHGPAGRLRLPANLSPRFHDHLPGRAAGIQPGGLPRRRGDQQLPRDRGGRGQIWTWKWPAASSPRRSNNRGATVPAPPEAMPAGEPAYLIIS